MSSTATSILRLQISLSNRLLLSRSAGNLLTKTVGDLLSKNGNRQTDKDT